EGVRDAPAGRRARRRSGPTPMRCALAVLAVFAAGACTGVATSIGGKPGPEAGLLRGKAPVRSARVTHADRLTDRLAAAPDDPPRTELTALFRGSGAYVVYDLGADTRVDCAAIVADGDDAYTLSLSSDGAAFTPLWTAPLAAAPGMQLRAARELRGA